MSDNNEKNEKPKRTITPEQREKMALGRKRAMEERRATKELIKKEETSTKALEKKLLKEQSKQEVRETKLKKEAQKKKDLEDELAGLQQQKDRIEALKKTMENRNKFREKIIKFKEEEDDNQRPKMIIEPKEFIKVPMCDDDDDDDDAPHHTSDIVDKEEIVRKEVEKLLGTAKNTKVRDIFKKITNSYNKNMDVTQNLKIMMDDLKKLIVDNTKELKKSTTIIQNEEDKKDIVEKTLDEVKEEVKYKSQLSSLMRLR